MDTGSKKTLIFVFVKINNMKKTLFIVLGIIFGCAIVLFIIWHINNVQNEKQLNNDLASRFDQTMTESYPFVRNLSEALLLREQMFQDNATFVYRNLGYLDENNFRYLNTQYLNNTQQGQFLYYWISQEGTFISSLTYGFLQNGGELRKEESNAVVTINHLIRKPEDISEIEYDSLMIIIDKRKLLIHESINKLSRYSNNGDVNAWRYPTYDDRNIFKRYYSRKNWPFTFLNKKSY